MGCPYANRDFWDCVNPIGPECKECEDTNCCHNPENPSVKKFEDLYKPIEPEVKAK